MLAKKCFWVGIFMLFSVSVAMAAPPAVHPLTGEPLVIDCLRGTPEAIDGDLSDWNLEAMTPAVLDVAEQLFSGQESWTGPEDCSGEFYLLWDDVNIYVAVVVKDDKLSMNKTGGDIWNADCVEIFFATTNAVAGHAEHYQYGFNANNQRWNWCNIDGAGSIEPDYLQIASTLTADGYICEAAIPYAQMPSLDFSVGNAIGFHPVFDDTDDGDRELQMTWTGREAHDQSLGFGHMILSADSALVPVDMKIGYAIQPPVIDGEVDGIWGGASTQSFVPLADPADGSGTWQVLYDMENLYVIVDVTDDSLQNDSASSWQDDSVEIYFDGGNTKLSTPLSGDDHQYTFGWTANDIQGTNIAGYTEGIEQAQVTTATGWRIEVKMPWLSIQGVAPQAGDLIGIDCYYNDDDDGGDSREGKMLSFSAVEGWNDASQWATAVLAAIPEPVDPGADGLAASYALENDVLDGSGNGNDGTIVGNPTWIPGVLGTALEFHGLGASGGGGDYINCGSGASLDITGPISLALWIRPDADDPEGKATTTAPMAKAMSGMSPSWSYQVRYGWNSPQPYMAFTFNTSPRAWAYVGQNLVQGEWAHIACSHDGTTLKCYLDGAQTDSTPMGQITSSPAPVLIGSDGWGCDWIGGIDEVAIYDRGLSDGEILYLAGRRVNLVQNPSFEEDEVILDDPDWAQWCTWNAAEGAGSNATIVDTDAIDGARSLRIEPKGIENWHFIVAYISFPLNIGTDSTTTFWAKAEADRPLAAQMKAADNTISWGYTDFQLTTEWAEYTMTTTAESVEGKLEFFCAGSEVPLLLDLVSVYE